MSHLQWKKEAWKTEMRMSLKHTHARLLSTRPELLPSWKQTFNSYEAFMHDRDPFSTIYTSMIDNTIRGIQVDYDSLVE